MTPQEWIDAQDAVFDDIKGIIRAQRTLDDLKKELAERRENQSQEDRIFKDAYDLEPGQPRSVFFSGGVEIEITLLHRKGIGHSDIMGADLLYEIPGRKFILIQYKRPTREGRVIHDSTQLDELTDACPNACPPWS